MGDGMAPTDCTVPTIAFAIVFLSTTERSVAQPASYYGAVQFDVF